jgi:hypothetical protein
MTPAHGSSVAGSPVGLDELLLGVRSGRETDEHDVGGKDGDGDSSGSILMCETTDEEVDGREIRGAGGVGSVVTGLYTEPGGKTGKITPAGTAWG